MKPVLVYAAFSLMALRGPVLACDSKHPEDFTSFFTKFSDEKKFALSRTVYPSLGPRYEYRIEDGEQQITERRHKVARQDDARYPARGDYMKSIGLQSKTQRISQNEAVAEVFKPGSSGLATYHFSLTRIAGFCAKSETILSKRVNKTPLTPRCVSRAIPSPPRGTIAHDQKEFTGSFTSHPVVNAKNF